MIYAMDANKKRISAREAKRGEEYRCPLCDDRLELRRGDIRIPHFAHWKNTSCIDSWQHDMSEWHYSWQQQFPEDCQEVVVEKDGEKHRADVLIKEHNVVVEFQHSILSPEEFVKRNNFYSECGYHVIWLFDMTNDFNDRRFSLLEEDKVYEWKRPWRTFAIEEDCVVNFGGSLFYQTNVTVFFENNGLIERLFEYNSQDKKVQTSFTDNNRYFQWSKYTFLLWLKKSFQETNLVSPKCPVCKKNTKFRQTSWGDYVWGCVDWQTEINCKGMINLGNVPEKVSIDGRCPFCEGRIYYSSLSNTIYCIKCNYSVKIKIFD